MNKALLQDEVREFILNHLDADIHDLVLKGVPFKNVSAAEIATQVRGVNSIKQTVPSFYQKGLVYPSRISLEQMSSEKAARYKASLFDNLHTFIDCTGGFGIDSFFLSEKAVNSHYCETDKDLFEIATHNFSLLQKNIQTHHTDGLDFLKLQSNHSVDLAYLDPSRRTETKKKIISLDQSTPDIIANWTLLLTKARKVLVKVSPMLDIDYLIHTLDHLGEIHILSVKNDVKELLLLAGAEYENPPKIIATDISEKQAYSYELINKAVPIETVENFSSTGYIYEPFGVLLKANAQDMYAAQQGLKKVAPNSHLYMGTKLITAPLLKTYKYQGVYPLKKKRIRNKLKNNQVNVVCRNFPLSPNNVLKKLSLRQGGEQFLLCTRNIQDKPVCFLSERV